LHLGHFRQLACPDLFDELLVLAFQLRVEL
jgi:hypothetical protein